MTCKARETFDDPRCRCGKLKTEASDGCTWHEARAERLAATV